MVQQTSYRIERINELMRRELVLLLKKDTKDPRLQNVIITDVLVSRDLSSARVFYSVVEPEQQAVDKLLEKAAGFFRTRLSQTLALRHTPALQFTFDPTPNTGARIETLLSKL